MDDRIRITKPIVSSTPESSSTSENASSSTQEQAKIQKGIASAKDAFEPFKSADPIFSVDTGKGQVKFGDGSQGQIPKNDSNIRNSYQSGLGQTGNVSSRWQQFVSEEAANGGAVDPNALVQEVLRESYVQTTEDLSFYAEKVKYFNQCKKEVRDYLDGLRDAESASKLERLTPGRSGNVMEEVFAVIRDGIQGSNEDKEYYLRKLQDMSEISHSISQQQGLISDDSQRLAAKEKDDDDP
jgi:hypothetical protein